MPAAAVKEERRKRKRARHARALPTPSHPYGGQCHAFLSLPLPPAPFQAKLTDNYTAYSTALAGLDSLIGYAVKANNNLPILKHLCKLGSGAVLVSGNELALALEAGFDPARTIFNGNGKLPAELAAAVAAGTLINIDSEFDLHHLAAAAESAG